MRAEVASLVSFGRLPEEREATEQKLEQIEALLLAITPPVSDEEACALAALFGPDSCFGLAWTLVHLIESAPGWPLWECLPREPEWRDLMLISLRNAGFSAPWESGPSGVP